MKAFLGFTRRFRELGINLMNEIEIIDDINHMKIRKKT
jgi:hypothetical protein